MLDKEFCCPHCASHKFGSRRENEGDDSPWLRYCKGCEFEWYDFEDHKYFYKVTETV